MVTTIYYATTLNSNGGCTLTDSVLVTVNQRSNTTSPGTVAQICSGDTITLDASPKEQQIIWSPAETLSDATIYNPVASPLQTTTYTAVVTDSATCATQTVPYTIVVSTRPAVDAGPDKFYTRGTRFSISPVYSSNVASYIWTPQGSLNCTDCPNPRTSLVWRSHVERRPARRTADAVRIPYFPARPAVQQDRVSGNRSI